MKSLAACNYEAVVHNGRWHSRACSCTEAGYTLHPHGRVYCHKCNKCFQVENTTRLLSGTMVDSPEAMVMGPYRTLPPKKPKRARSPLLRLARKGLAHGFYVVGFSVGPALFISIASQYINGYRDRVLDGLFVCGSEKTQFNSTARLARCPDGRTLTWNTYMEAWFPSE